MKMLTTREFFHAPALTKALRPGQSFLVTDDGKPSFIVTKAGKRRVKTADEFDREAKKNCPTINGVKVNFTEILKSMKK